MSKIMEGRERLPSETPPGRSEEKIRLRSEDSIPAIIGVTLFIKGDIDASEDLTIDGRVEGHIRVGEHALTIGPGAKVHADVNARTVVVLGDVTGNIIASGRAEIGDTGNVVGDISAPRIAISDGARLKGTIDMVSPKSRPVSSSASQGELAKLTPEGR